MINPNLPPGMTEDEFAQLDEGSRKGWLQFVLDLRWLMEQPQFRRVAFRFIDDPAFCGASTDVFSIEPLLMARKSGLVAAGRLLQVHMQHVAPKMWRRLLNEEYAAREAAEVNNA